MVEITIISLGIAFNILYILFSFTYVKNDLVIIFNKKSSYVVSC